MAFAENKFNTEGLFQKDTAYNLRKLKIVKQVL